MKRTDRPAPRGRPALTVGDTPAHVNLTVPSRDYDRVYAIARRQGISVPAVLRRGLARELADDEPDAE